MNGDPADGFSRHRAPARLRDAFSRRRFPALLLGLAAGLALLDIALDVNGSPTTGWAGPHANLVLQLAVDATLPLLLKYPRTVAAIALAVTAALAGSDVFAPGLLVPVDPITSMTVPSATPVVIIGVVRLLDRSAWLPIAGAFTVLGARLWQPDWEVTPFGLLSTAVPTLVAVYYSTRQDLMLHLRHRAERAERERHLLAEQARAEERRQLATEMHDVVTHRISLMVLQAGALGVRTKEDETRQAANDIRVSGTQALDELRDLIGVLHGSKENEPEPVRGDAAGTRRSSGEQPPLDPAVLVEECESVGVHVDFARAGASSDVSPTVARTAYRIIQEALTNVRKHAPSARVTVDLRYRKDGVDVTVENAAPERTADPALAGTGSGTGLSSLRQRVELIGGSLETGVTTGGGYRVRATLPAYVPTAGSRSLDSLAARR
ncbi:sensor histidine kinase [Amycolatopsis minnesotensis]|uniref:sensor histidine kinase n=1 Tax=Amycolatopsis minnesotensis TaxID=337894 RepID=UPI0031D8425A